MLDIASAIYAQMPTWAVVPLFAVAVFCMTVLRYFDPRPTTKNTFYLCIIGMLMYVSFEWLDVPVRGILARIWIMAFVLNEAILKPFVALKYLYIPAFKRGYYPNVPRWAVRFILLLDSFSAWDKYDHK